MLKCIHNSLFNTSLCHWRYILRLTICHCHETYSMAIIGGMGWKHLNIRHTVYVKCFGFWIDLCLITLTKNVFNWDISHGHPWVTVLKSLLYWTIHLSISRTGYIVIFRSVAEKCCSFIEMKWSVDIWRKQKLHTYCLIKNNCGVELYVKYNLNKRQRPLCGQFSSGTH